MKHHPFKHHGPNFHHPRFQRIHARTGGRFLFPFVMFFAGMAFLFLIALSIIIFFSPGMPMDRPNHFRGFPLSFCGIPLIFLIVTMIVGSLTFRRFGRPMTEIFSAIDSVSEGDLSVRVPENYPRQFGLLMQRFNHMVSELERADQQRRNLTADIAHELRTPLHIIQGNLEGVIDGVYEPTSEHINNTLDETKLLARLVNDLQTLSLAEAGQLPLHPTRFLLADLLQDLTSSFSSQASSLGISFQTKISDSSIELNADYDRLNQVLSNLISNSFRHTPESGQVTINAEKAENKIRIEVKDTGEGISTEDLPFIFDRFWRGDKSRTRESGTHSGLGLAIAKQIVLAHGGTIDVESEMGEGTKFIIELPNSN